MSICETLYEKKPDAALLSVLGYQFLFSRQLSETTSELVPQAIDLLWKWLSDRKVVD
jgi:hypothetical protein